MGSDSTPDAVSKSLQVYVDSLVGAHYGDRPFGAYLRTILRIPGFILSNEEASGLMSGVLLTFHAVAPERDWQDVIPAVAAVELTHNAWELLDKILDDEPLSSLIEWDISHVSNAIGALQMLANFALLDLPSRGFSPQRVSSCLRGISEMCARVAEANHLDLVAEHIPNPTWDLGMEVTRGKSAPIDQVIGPIGAGLATDDPVIVQRCTELGSAVGIYLALVNDLNDCMPGHEFKSDVRRRKKTLPIVYLMINTRPGEYEQEKQILRGIGPMAPEDEARVRAALAKCGAIEYGGVLAEAHRLKAQSLAESLAHRADLSRVMKAFRIALG